MRLLIVEDDPTLRAFLSAAAREQGLDARVASRGDEAIRLLAEHDFDLVLSDVKLPGADGLAVLRAARARSAETQVVLMTAYATIDLAVEAMKEGAREFLQKPFTTETVEALWKAVKAQVDLRRDVDALQRSVEAPELFGEDGGLREVMSVVRRVAPGDASVLITGESGVGKELVARALHQFSGRPAARLVSLHIPSIPETLIEAELFGYVRGAFTGAHKSRAGLIELADGGTLFLDEIGDLAASAQSKLLRVLQERRFRRVGSNDETTVTIRVVAATNRDLAADIQTGRFREDLYYRLNVVPLFVPPLRDRPDDIPGLVEHFIRRHALRLRSPVRRVAPRVMELYKQYGWPGNVRELENVVCRAMSLASGEELTESYLEIGATAARGLAAAVSQPGFSLPEYLAQQEQEAIRTALKLEQGVRSRAAERLGLARTTLLEKMTKHGIQG